MSAIHNFGKVDYISALQFFERLSTGQKDIFSFLEWNTQHIYEIQLIRLIESNLCSLFTFGSIYGLKKKWAYKYAGIEGSKFASL